MAAEAGHHSSRFYVDQNGDVHFNGASVFDSNEVDIASEIDTLTGLTASSTELNVLDGVTAGTVTASKGLVVDASKALDVLGLSSGAAAAAVAMRFGGSANEGLEIKVIDETVNPAAVETDLTEDVPSGAVILSAQINVESAGSAAGTTSAYGLGTSGDPDKYGETSDLTQNQKIDTIPDWAVLSGAEDVTVRGTNGSGADGDSSPGGSVRVRIVYAVPNSLDDA